MQNKIAEDNRPKFQNADRMKAPAGGQAGAPLRFRRVEHEFWCKFMTPWRCPAYPLATKSIGAEGPEWPRPSSRVAV